MNIFRQLRWKLTLSYTLVTVSALLVILLVMAGILFTQIFVPKDYLNPEGMIDAWMNGRMRSDYPCFGAKFFLNPRWIWNCSTST